MDYLKRWLVKIRRGADDSHLLNEGTRSGSKKGGLRSKYANTHVAQASWLTFLAAGILLILTAVTSSARPIVTNQTEATGVTVPLYGLDKNKPAAVLRIGKLSVGSRRQGFFRVGILPVLLAEKAEIAFKPGPPDPSVLDDLTSAFEALGKTSSAELHDFSIVIDGHPVLTARECEPATGGIMRLTKATIPAFDSADTATLRTAGENAGEVNYDKDGIHKKLNIFKKTNPSP